MGRREGERPVFLEAAEMVGIGQGREGEGRERKLDRRRGGKKKSKTKSIEEDKRECQLSLIVELQVFIAWSID